MHVHNPGFYKDITRRVRAMRARIGANVHAARLQRGVTMERLARLSGLPPRVIDHIELGKGETDLHHLTALAVVLRVDVATLLSPPPIVPERRLG